MYMYNGERSVLIQSNKHTVPPTAQFTNRLMNIGDEVLYAHETAPCTNGLINSAKALHAGERSMAIKTEQTYCFHSRPICMGDTGIGYISTIH